MEVFWCYSCVSRYLSGCISFPIVSFPLCFENGCVVSQYQISSWGFLCFYELNLLGELLKDMLIFQATYCHLNISNPNNVQILDPCQNSIAHKCWELFCVCILGDWGEGEVMLLSGQKWSVLSCCSCTFHI